MFVDTDNIYKTIKLRSFNLLKYEIFFNLDIDECLEGIHICSDICINTISSFSCGCSQGFTLSNDRITCLGIIHNIFYDNYVLVIYCQPLCLLLVYIQSNSSICTKVLFGCIKHVSILC